MYVALYIDKLLRLLSMKNRLYFHSLCKQCAYIGTSVLLGDSLFSLASSIIFNHSSRCSVQLNWINRILSRYSPTHYNKIWYTAPVS